jgi:N-methylhydantoinase A
VTAPASTSAATSTPVPGSTSAPVRVRVGVDVGGTFTKAVAIDVSDRRLVASSIVPTTHDAVGGVAKGVVDAVVQLAEQVGADRIDLVTHSTTQAVNALLEGDVGVVGVIGLGRRPDLRQTEKRTRINDIELTPGKLLKVTHAFFDVSDGLPKDEIRSALVKFKAEGVVAMCVAEAFSPDDSTNEDAVTAIAREVRLAACASTELSGLYGLELRAVTAALNASIVPIAVSTAGFVADGVKAAGIHAPVMVMRSDGGATDLAGFSAAPVRTLYSGPSASVSGALRYTGVTDAIVIEVGGTSTNVAAIRHGRPSLSYVRVASHSTAMRSVDVRVEGVAGGSMIRVKKGRVYGVGPRSAHIAGLSYACFVTDPSEFDGATMEVISPKPGDPLDTAIIRTVHGARYAVTNTCAANALGVAQAGDYCYSKPDSARAAFAVLARSMKLDADTIARHALAASGRAVCELALAVAQSSKLDQPTIIGVGGGAGGLARHVAAMLGWPIVIPEHAEIISSIGDALSLLRAERERTADASDTSVIESMMEEVEREIVAAGASPASVEVRLEEMPERSAIRAVATGSVGLSTGALPGRQELSEAEIRQVGGPENVTTVAGQYWLSSRQNKIDLLDRFGDTVTSIVGEVTSESALAKTVETHTKYRGPVTLRPTIWIVDGRRIIELAASEAKRNPFAGRTDVTYIVGRSR